MYSGYVYMYTHHIYIHVYTHIYYCLRFFLHVCSLMVYLVFLGMSCYQAGRGTRVGPFVASGWTEAATRPQCIPLVGRPVVPC